MPYHQVDVVALRDLGVLTTALCTPEAQRSRMKVRIFAMSRVYPREVVVNVHDVWNIE